MAVRSRDVEAAGVVVFRPGREVLLVHRPKYDDWSFPKGKLDPGEHVTAAAVREVEEETGLRVRLTRPLHGQRYQIVRGWKRVHYWTGRVLADGPDGVTGYQRPGEIDEVVWVPIDKALRLLTYTRDKATLREAIAARKRTTPLIVLRHAESRARRSWHGDDRQRPLLAIGRKRAERLAGVLAAYGVTRVVSSDSTRCVQTVQPYADLAGVPLETTGLLSEEEVADRATMALMRDLRAGLPESGPLVVCTHRPVLPLVFRALGVRNLQLRKGELAVLHVRKGRIVGVERHLPH
jgi:8-oxo-(d)GTP phosphatase